MKATIITIALDPSKPGRQTEYPGWLVPDTEDTLAIDCRIPADIVFMEPAWWFLTHLPTGRRINVPPHTDADTRERAVEVAAGFYREMKALGVDLTVSDPEAITKPVMDLGPDGIKDFWNKVAGWYDQRKMVETKVDELQAQQTGLVVNSDTTMHPAPSPDQPTGPQHE